MALTLPKFQSVAGTIIRIFGAIGLATFALLGAAYLQGWVTTVVEGDNTGLSVAIFVGRQLRM